VAALAIAEAAGSSAVIGAIAAQQSPAACLAVP
jgi:hypothetical protein